MKTTREERQSIRETALNASEPPRRHRISIHTEELLRLLDDADEAERLKEQNDQLRDGIDLLFHFVPAWAQVVPDGLDPTMYGTGTADGDRAVKRQVDRIAALLERGDG